MLKLYPPILLAALALCGCEVLDPAPGPQPVSNAVPPGSSSVPGATPGTGSAGSSATVAHGEALYFQYCAVCHGADGGGAGPYPGSIQGATDMFQVVTQGAGEMPGFPQLNADDVRAMEAWLATFVNGGSGGAGVSRDGLGAYAVACAGCHGATGEGHRRGPQLRSPVVPYATHITRNGRSGVGYDDAMPAYGHAEISDTELEEMLAWLGSFPKPTDGAGLYGRFCANCHGADGRGGPTRASIRGDDLGDWFEAIREGEGGRNYGSRGDYMPRWSRSAITDDEVRKMYQHIRGGGGSTSAGDEEEEDDD
ncbi:MAG: c-type cytochrome [Bradymonadia bacterium]